MKTTLLRPADLSIKHLSPLQQSFGETGLKLEHPSKGIISDLYCSPSPGF